MKDRRCTYTEREIKVAMAMREDGESWWAIAKKLKRRNSDGIRRRLDAKHRKRCNKYQAEWQRENRAT